MNLQKRLLVIVDMQNDFIYGTLPAYGGEVLGEKIAKLASRWDGDILMTYDLHKDETYLNTQEGLKLPIKHCICGTDGATEIDQLSDIADNSNTFKFFKDAFVKNQLLVYLTHVLHEKYLDEIIRDEDKDRYTKHLIPQVYDEIVLCGVCTDICVISNAILFKSIDPELEVTVIGDLCAGTTKENHEAALNLMKNSLQIDVVQSGTYLY